MDFMNTFESRNVCHETFINAYDNKYLKSVYAL